MPDKIDPDTLLREQLEAHNPMWAVVADALDEWLVRMHGITSGRHNSGLFLELLAAEGWEVSAMPEPGALCCPKCADRNVQNNTFTG